MVRRSFILALAALSLAPAAVLADREGHEDSRSLRKSLTRQDVIPLEDILKRIGPSLPGRVIEVETEYEDGRLYYEFYVLTPEGRRVEIYVDPTTGSIAKQKEGD